MATYNRAHLIEETLESIVNQTYQDWECLIIDDGGNDNTEEILQNWLKKDARFTYLKRTPNHQKGLPGCRNQGIELAKGDYIIFFDDDDIVHPQNLELCIRYLKNNDIDFVHYNKKPFKTNESISFNYYQKEYFDFVINSNNIYDSITGKQGLASCTMMWSRKVFNDFKFDDTLQYAEEWDLYNRLLIDGFSGHKIKNQLYFNRKHESSNTASYYNNSTIRTKSKIDASVSIINSLDKKNLLNIKYIKFFLGIRSKDESKPILNALLKSTSLTYKDKLYAKFRFAVLPRLKLLYKLKTRK